MTTEYEHLNEGDDVYLQFGEGTGGPYHTVGAKLFKDNAPSKDVEGQHTGFFIEHGGACFDVVARGKDYWAILADDEFSHQYPDPIKLTVTYF